MGNKGGRPRNAGVERYASGRLKYTRDGRQSSKPTAEPMSGALLQRLWAEKKRQGNDPRFFTELNRLYANAELRSGHVATGFQIAEIYGRFEGLHRVGRSARSPSYEASFGDASVHEDLLTPEEIKNRQQWAAKVEDDFRHLQSYMVTLPRELRNAVEELCVEDRNVAAGMYEAIRLFLTRIAVILEQRRKQKSHHAHRLSPREAKHSLRAAAKATKRQVVARPKTNLERAAWIKAMRRLRPDLSYDQIIEAYTLFRALKDNAVEHVRADRRRKEGEFARRPHPSTEPKITIDAPPLALRDQPMEPADAE